MALARIPTKVECCFKKAFYQLLAIKFDFSDVARCAGVTSRGDKHDSTGGRAWRMSGWHRVFTEMGDRIDG